jgi:hypothetical protein
MMRLRVNGGAPTVWVGAAKTGSKKGAIPATPGNGSGAPLDVSEFGGAACIVSGVQFSGSAQLEVSDDGVAWSPFAFFTGPGVASQPLTSKFIRCTRAGAQTVSANAPILSIVASNDVGDAGSTALTEPALGFVYRPFDPAGVDYDNVYVSWTNLMAAIESARKRGPLRLYFDARFSPDFDGIAASGRRAITIPSGTWDMFNVIWGAHPEKDFFSGCSIIFDEDCHIVDLQMIDSPADFVLVNRSSVNVPIVLGGPGKLLVISGYLQVANNSIPGSVPFNPTAKPIFKIEDGGGFAPLNCTSTFACLGLHIYSGPTTPLLDLNGGGLVLTGLLFNRDTIGASQPNSCIITIGSFNNDSGFGNTQDWIFTDPGMATTTFLVDGDTRTRYWMDVDNVVITPAVGSPYVVKHNQCINADTTLGQLDLTMPTAKISRGDKVFIKDWAGVASPADPIVITAMPGESIEGAASYTISVANGGVTTVSDGQGRWMIESKI